MQYEIVVIGATFLAAGLAQKFGDRCLIIERRPQAGYEFLNALKFGTDYSEELKSIEAKDLYKKFTEKKAFDGDRICLFDCAGPFYNFLEGKNILLNMEIITTEKTDEAFKITLHGVSGYRTVYAKKVIDTTVHDDMILSKSLNFLVNTDAENAPALPEHLETEKCGYEEDTLLKCPLSPDDDYIKARRALKEMINSLPTEYRVVFVADCFDYELKPGYMAEKDGISYLPSCAYKNPLLAFDAGILYAKGVMI